MTRLRSHLGPTMAASLGIGLVTALGGAGLEIAALVKGGLVAIPVHILAVLLLAAAALLVASALLGLARVAKYGETWLEVSRDRSDGALEGVVEATLQPVSSAVAVITFACQRATSLASGGHARGGGGWDTKVLHRATVEVPRGAMLAESGRVRIPFRIALPTDLPQPGDGESPSGKLARVTWLLTCHVDAPGLALRAPFELVDPPTPR